MQDIADDFVENVAAFACELAVHRGGTTLEAKDIQLALGTLSGLLS
jgi:transcription initiation factor TFIID subunit 12